MSYPTVTMPQLLRIVEELQWHDAANPLRPGAEPSGLTVLVDVDPPYTRDDAEALIELGRPYGLVAGYRTASRPKSRGAAS